MQKSIRVLGKLVEWTAKRHHARQADPRHAELIRKSFGETGRSVTTPGVRDKLDDIQEEGHRSTRSQLTVIARIRCVHSDSPVTELRHRVACRDLARQLQQPSTLDEMGLKRLARFLGVRPRPVWLFKWQKRVTRIESWCDTDHAGCIRTRKSVSGCALMLGGRP